MEESKCLQNINLKRGFNQNIVFGTSNSSKMFFAG